jgi:hypothetical protein
MSQSKTLKTVVLNVGQLTKRELKELKRGQGQAFEQAVASATVAADGLAPAMPVVILLEKRPKKRPLLLSALLRGR